MVKWSTLSVEQRVSVLEGAVTSLGERLGQGDDLQAVADSSGLSTPMVQWALEQELHPWASGTLFPIWKRHIAGRGHQGKHLLVLAGNLFTGCIKPILYSLVSGSELWVKPSRRDLLFPTWFCAAVRDTSESVGCTAPVTMVEDGLAMVGDVDRVEVFGSDATIATWKGALQHSNPVAGFVGHGHGLGVALVTPEGLENDAEHQWPWAQALAMDVAAYDQRGCLSPHAVILLGGDNSRSGSFGLQLHRALTDLEEKLPRGTLSVEQRAEEHQWRAVASTVGTLWEGEAHGVSWEGHLQSLRPSPGLRNISLFQCENMEQVVQILAPVGSHLRALAVAGHCGPAVQGAASVYFPQCRIMPAGAMQKPPLYEHADGTPAMEAI